MTIWRKSPARSWILVALYAASIFATLSLVRPLVTALRERGVLGLWVTIAFGAAITVAIYALARGPLPRRARPYLLLVLVVLAWAWLFMSLTLPEERIHILQYGLLAILVRRALAWHTSEARQYLGALLITAALGLGDELVQGILPTRVYDTRDVAINAVSATLALVASFALRERSS